MKNSAGNSEMMNHGEDTLNHVRLLKRDRTSGALYIDREPIVLDRAILKRLVERSQQLRDKDADITQHLLETYIELRSVQDSSGIPTLQTFLDDLQAKMAAIKRLDKSSPTNGKQLFATSARFEFPVPPNRMAKLFQSKSERRDALPTLEELEVDEDKTKRASALLNELSALMSIADQAKEAYKEVFEDYLADVETIFPGITELEPRDYCTNLQGRFANAELNTNFTPENVLLVDQVNMYYRAAVLKGMIERLASDESVVGYSNRYVGYHCQQLILDDEDSLVLKVCTNFGYGDAKHFYATLSYRGISVLNAAIMIFYSGRNADMITNATKTYRIEEKSFQTLFDDAIHYHQEFVFLGEQQFVERYILGSIRQLDSLFRNISQFNSFVDISEAAFFEDLVDSDYSVFVSRAESRERAQSLNQDDKRLLEHFANTVKKELAEKGAIDYCLNEGLQELRSSFRVKNNESLSEQVGRVDSARSYLHSILDGKLANQDVQSLMAKAFEPAYGYHKRELFNQDLAVYRTRKAEKVLERLSDIKALCEVAHAQRYYDSLVATCALIADQDRRILEEEIDPYLTKIRSEVEEAISSHNQAESCEISKNGPKVMTDVRIEQVNELECELRKLEHIKAELEHFMDKVNAI